MSVIISKNLLGTKKHLVHDGDNFSWSDECSRDYWKLGFDREVRDIGVLADAANISLCEFDKTPAGKAVRSVYGNAPIPWMHALTDSLFHKQLRSLLDQLWMLLEDESNGYYMHQFLVNREILMGLYRPKVDVALLRQMIKDDKSSKVHDLKRFLPDNGDIAPRTVYSQTGSVTGRLTVSSGPNILTLKKEYRKILKSRFENGKIVQIDVSSLEPRIALSMAENDQPADIYDHVGATILENRLERDKVKIAILNCIYGGSEWSLSKRLPDDLDIKSIMNVIMRYFRINDLKDRLHSEAIENGCIKNLYGRRIPQSGALVNHFLQSSGVDVSFNIFLKIIKNLSSLDITFVPIYIIHDAIVLDIPLESYDKITNVIKDGFIVDKLGCIFPVKLETIKE